LDKWARETLRREMFTLQTLLGKLSGMETGRRALAILDSMADILDAAPGPIEISPCEDCKVLAEIRRLVHPSPGPTA